LDTAKSIYLGGTLLSILISLYLFITGKRESGIFVGLWAPTVLNLGQTLLDANLHEKVHYSLGRRFASHHLQGFEASGYLPRHLASRERYQAGLGQSTKVVRAQ
jgi:hypothetical protein